MSRCPFTRLARPGFCTMIVLFVLGVIGPVMRSAEDPANRSGNPATKAPAAYAIAPTDRIKISVYQEEDLSVTARVDAKGAVNLPLVGEVIVAGKSVSEAQKFIESAYR